MHAMPVGADRLPPRPLSARPGTVPALSHSFRESMSRTGWGLDIPTDQPRPPSSLFSSLGVQPPGQHASYQQSLYVTKWQPSARPGWGANLLPHRPGPFSAALGATTSRPCTPDEKRSVAWKPKTMTPFKPPPHDPIHSRSPDKVVNATRLWSTSSSAFSKLDLGASSRLPTFGVTTGYHVT